MHSIHKFAKRTTLSLFLRQNGEFFCGSVITSLTKFLKFFIVYAQLFPQAPFVQIPPEISDFLHPQPDKSLFSSRRFTPVFHIFTPASKLLVRCFCLKWCRYLPM